MSCTTAGSSRRRTSGKDRCDYPLAETLARRLGKPARLLNDAEVQGLGIIKGQGLEVVLTLGTGVGSAIFSNGALTPHLELAQHPIHKDETYNEYVGNAARQALSSRKWNKRVLRVIEHVYSLVHYDVLYLGGGNPARVTVALPDNIHQLAHPWLESWQPTFGHPDSKRP